MNHRGIRFNDDFAPWMDSQISDRVGRSTQRGAAMCFNEKLQCRDFLSSGHVIHFGNLNKQVTTKDV